MKTREQIAQHTPMSPVTHHTRQRPEVKGNITPQLPITFPQQQQSRVTRAYPLEELEDNQGPQRTPRSALRWRATTQQHQTQQSLSHRRTQTQAQTRQPGPSSLARPHPRRSSNRWTLYLLVGVLVALALWVVFNVAWTWAEQVYDDWVYGTPRTYQVDAVVGHNHDSRQHPSHFIALNLHGHIEIIELPASDPSKVVVYQGPTLSGEGRDQEVVTISFQDVDHNGTSDLILHVGENALVMLNKDGKFEPPSGQ